MRVRALAAVAAFGLIVPVAAASSAQAAPAGTALVTVVHGIAIPDLEVVDVYVDGALTFDNFTFEDVLDAELPAGEYLIEVKGPESEADDVALLTETFNVTGDATIVAQVDADGAPQLVAYPDDYSPTAAGNARVVVRHAAALAAVSVDANGSPLIPDVSNGGSVALEVPAGTYAVQVKVGGEPVEGLALPGITLVAGVSYTVYAVGDDDNGYTVLPSIVTVGEEAATPTASASATTKPAIPTAVPAGDGTSGWSGPLGLPALLAITLAAGLALAAGFALRGNAASHRS